MTCMRATIRQIIEQIVPEDALEKEHVQIALRWIHSGAEIFRLEKPATPETHLVSYFILIDVAHKKVLLVDHIKAEAWLPPGGHVEPGEHPLTTVRREIVEELGVEANLLFEEPLFLTMTRTTGKTAGHTDVSLWYVLKGNSKEDLNFDSREFHQIKWFPFDALPQNSELHLNRFLLKVKNTMAFQTFIEEQSEIIERLETAAHLAWWNLAVTGNEKYADEMKEARVALRNHFSELKPFQFLTTQPPPSDLQLQRQATLLLLAHRENQIPKDLIEQISSLEAGVETVYTNFRPCVDGELLSNNSLKKILVESLDSNLRQKAWEASKHIGEQVEGDVLKLIQLRNASAVKAGFSNYYSMRLELQELDETELFALLDKLERLTKPLWQSYKASLDHHLSQRYGIVEEELKPWHYTDPFFQEAPREDLNFDSFYASQDLVDIASSYFRFIGFDVEDILRRSDLYERENKNQHAFCTCMDRKQDIRMLCNMRDNEYWMGTLLHELGHAVYDQYIDPALPYLLRTPAHTSTTEASAMLFGRLSKESAFLEQFCHIPSEKIQPIAELAKRQNSAHLLVFARWSLVMIHFERAMYQQPEANLNAIWWNFVERFQSIKPLPNRSKPDWAAKLHLACAPVYYQNYILGEMTASQLFHFLGKRLNQKEVGETLTKQLYRLGALYPWNETLKRATGELLNPAYFAEDLNNME